MKAQIIATFLISALPNVYGRDFVRSGSALSSPEKVTLWDMGITDMCDRQERQAAPRYIWYSDGEISEIIDGRRLRYMSDSVGVRWITEETTLMRLTLQSPVYTSGFSGDDDIRVEYESEGQYTGGRKIREHGLFESFAPISGVAVLGCDSIRATLRVEKRTFSACIKDDTRRDSVATWGTITDSIRYESVRYRWFASGDIEPFATQYEVAVYGPDGKEKERLGCLYTIDYVELKVEDAEDPDIETLLKNARIETDGRKARITVDFDGPLSVGVSTLGGIPCLTEMIDVRAGESVEIPLGDVLPGEYVLGLRVGEIHVRHFINVR